MRCIVGLLLGEEDYRTPFRRGQRKIEGKKKVCRSDFSTEVGFGVSHWYFYRFRKSL